MILIALLSILALIFITIGFALVFMRLPQFGALPSGAALARIQKSPNYKNGQFHNQSHTPSLAEGESYLGVFWKFFFGRSKRSVPPMPIKSVKTDLFALDRSEDVLVWFGHSSYFIQIHGIRILVDPVLSGYASPVSFTTKAFPGSNIYSVNDIPDVDILLLTHDHWDHLDYNVVTSLKPRIGRVVCPLGVGSHLERWGYRNDAITEVDWYDLVTIDEHTSLRSLPARHFSGRGFQRNRSLWTSYMLTSHDKKIFLGGDSGYDKHFKEIGAAYGPIDLAILENGQYNTSWRYIHALPHETLKAADDLKVTNVIPVHSSKFVLSLHAWNEPLEKISTLNAQRDRPLHLITPRIGEVVKLDQLSTTFEAWWRA